MVAVAENPRTGVDLRDPIIPGPDHVPEAPVLEAEFKGLYERLIRASVSPPDKIPHLLNPDPRDPIRDGDAGSAESAPLESVNFNRVAGELAFLERDEAWKGVSFDVAFPQWVERKVESINTTTDEKRIYVLERVYRKQVGEIGEEEVRDLYDRSGGENDSNVNGFIDDLVDTFSTDGTVDTQSIKDHIEEIEEVAGGIFGKKSAKVIVRGAELKAAIRNGHQRVVSEILPTSDRINNLNDLEREILDPLHKSLTNGQIETGHDPEVSPVRTPQTPEFDLGSKSVPDYESLKKEERILYVSDRDRKLQDIEPITLSTESENPWQKAKQAVTSSPDEPVILRIQVPLLEGALNRFEKNYKGKWIIHTDPDPEKKRLFIEGVPDEGEEKKRISLVGNKNGTITVRLGAYDKIIPKGFLTKMKREIKSNISNGKFSRKIDSIQWNEKDYITVIIL